MGPGESFEPRDELVDARVVLHGAGAQRIHAEIDGVVPGGEAREVADDIDFAHFRKAFDTAANVLRAERDRGIDCRHVERGKLATVLAGRAALEHQRLVL